MTVGVAAGSSNTRVTSQAAHWPSRTRNPGHFPWFLRAPWIVVTPAGLPVHWTAVDSLSRNSHRQTGAHPRGVWEFEGERLRQSVDTTLPLRAERRRLRGFVLGHGRSASRREPDVGPLGSTRRGEGRWKAGASEWAGKKPQPKVASLRVVTGIFTGMCLR